MSNDQTIEQQQEQMRKDAETIIQWRDTKCPKGLLDPLTLGLHPITAAKMEAYLKANGDLISFTNLDKAVDALWSELIWFGAMPPKPQPKRTPKPEPKYDPPLRKCDMRNVREKLNAEKKKQHQETQKAIDEASKKRKKAKGDERPGAVYFPEGSPQSNKINWAETKRLQTAWDEAHNIFDL